MLNRTIVNPEYEALLKEISRVIEQCVDFGGTVLETIQKHPINEYTDSTVYLLLRDYLEYLDGISILVRGGNTEAAIPIIRSMFEHFLSIRFILSKHSADRAASYHVAHIKSRIKLHKQFSKEEIGKFQKMLKDSDYSFTLTEVDATEQIQNLNTLLMGKYKRINDEWEETRKRNKKEKSGGKTPNWYSLFNGPKTLYELAAHLKKLPEYELLYRTWSAKAHANSAIHSVFSTGYTKPLRTPESLKTVSTWALTWSFTLFEEILNKYRKRKKQTHAWFYIYLRKTYMRITSGEDLIKIIQEK
ncbi:DUF5677 domain-containing protein [Paenibacillus xylanilyticus]|uniref:DUF5677 domain-containing protein n=1 Tax=Paenibacillus xylanilyticus TaxID=248903 RepID=UPI00129EF1F9|nr:DUF5677 domain-containing protein [Paenibacillus xylanilyticus]